MNIKKSWWFESESNPDKAYETLLYEDGNTSCNCFGWTRRCKNGVRSCKHTRMVEAGIADSYCVKSLEGNAKAPERPVQKPVMKIKPESQKRKIQWR